VPFTTLYSKIQSLNTTCNMWRKQGVDSQPDSWILFIIFAPLSLQLAFALYREMYDILEKKWRTTTILFSYFQTWGLQSKPYIWGGADMSLAWPGRKQATATKLGIYSTYSPWSSVHFLAHCSNFCKPLKKNSEGCPSNQVSAAAMTSTSDEKWWPFNCFFQSRERVVV